MTNNKLLILEKLGEPNKKYVAYEKNKKENRDKFFKEAFKYRTKLNKGEITNARFLSIEDSLKGVYGFKNSKGYKGGRWTQLGTLAKVYDLDSKTFIIENELKDNNGDIVIIGRDDANKYTLTVDDSNNVYVYGSMRSKNTRRGQQNLFLKFNTKIDIVWQQDVENYIQPVKEEKLKDVNFIFEELKTHNKKILNKYSGQFEDYEQTDILQKKVLYSKDIYQLNSLLFDKLEIDLRNKVILMKPDS